MVANRRASDAHWTYRAWIGLPLVDRATGEISLGRILASYFGFHAAVLIDAVAEQPETMSVSMGATITALVLATIGAAYSKAVFVSIAQRLMPKEVPVA